MKWIVTSDFEPDDSQLAIVRDDRLLEQGGVGDSLPLLRIWRTTKSIAVPRHFSQIDGFDGAAAVLGSRGWPVVLRSSGGSAMPQGPGIVNVSMVFPFGTSRGIESVFQMLTDPLRNFCSSLGFSATVGSVPGSFCDGSYNLVANQRKIAGTAQRRKKHAVLAHAALHVDLDLVETCRTINYLNERIGRNERCQPAAATTIKSVLDRELSVSQVVQELEDFFVGENGASYPAD